MSQTSPETEAAESMPGVIELAGIIHDAADGGTSEEYCSWTMANRAAEAMAKRLATVPRGHAQEAKDTLEVRQHIAWLFQYVQGMNERNWHDMKLRAERQLEQLSLAFPGPSDTSSVQPQTDWNYAPKPGQLSGPSSKD